MTCSWCGAQITDYGSHFQSYAGKPCRLMALDAQKARHPSSGLAKTPTARARLRRKTLRDLKTSSHADRGDQLLRDSTRQKDAHHEYRLHKRGLTQPPG